MPWVDRPGADIGAYVRSLPETERDWAEHHLLQWKRDGIVLLEGAVGDDAIEALLADVEHLISHHEAYELAVEVAGEQLPRIAEVPTEALRDPGTKFNNLHQISSAAVEVSLNAPSMRFLRHVFHDNPAVLQSLTFFRGSQQPIHVDYPYVCNQTKIAQLAASWVALEDVSIEAGALAYWPGAHDVELMGLFDWGGGSILYDNQSVREPIDLCRYLQGQVDRCGLSKQAFTPRRGDVLIWHGLMPHEGTPILNNALTRKSYVTHYTACEAYPRHFLKPNALEAGKYKERNGGYYFDVSWLDNPRVLPSSAS
ncbi:MAG TPA: phytanoyl-CoA dioxygenase family protein [Caulobacteraceae bacterium]|nr:phytanoyl-CoA dioxygenase family protein [Caulobacteraceae bacterium]